MFAALHLHGELQEPGIHLVTWNNFYLNAGLVMTSVHLHNETKYSSHCNAIRKNC